MSVPFRRANTGRSAAAGPLSRETFARWDVVPEDRIGPLPSRPGRKVVLLLIVLTASAGAWTYQDPDSMSRVWSQAKLVMASIAPAKPASGDKPVAAERPPAVVEPSGGTPERTARLPSVQERPPTPAATVLNESLPPAPLSPPSADQKPAAPASGAGYAPPPPPPADPLRQRAEAAGLHPEISRVLLARLSQSDFRNAGVAIETALAQTADDEALVWPRQRKPEEAAFRVHFVAGAAPACRRYIVTITKDGWSTTALPMEKCGVQRFVEKRK